MRTDLTKKYNLRHHLRPLATSGCLERAARKRKSTSLPQLENIAKHALQKKQQRQQQQQQQQQQLQRKTMSKRKHSHDRFRRHRHHHHEHNHRHHHRHHKRHHRRQQASLSTESSLYYSRPAKWYYGPQSTLGTRYYSTTNSYNWTFSPSVKLDQLRHFTQLPRMAPIVVLKNGYKFQPYPNLK